MLAQQKADKSERKVSIGVATDIFKYINDTYSLEIEGKKTSSYLAHTLRIEHINGRTNDKYFGIFSEGKDVVNGFGVGISQKWTAKKGAYGKFPYLMYGVSLRKISIKYKDVGFNSYQSDGLDYYQYGTFDDEVEIKSSLINLLTGVRLTAADHLIFDVYIGPAYRTSNSRSTYKGYREYNKDYSSFDYEGWLLQAGLKVGFKVR